jgi:hypothetical protein
VSLYFAEREILTNKIIMNRFKCFFVFITVFLFPFQSVAQQATEASEPLGMVITLYNQQYAGVFDKRTVDLRRGVQLVEVSNTPMMFDMVNLTLFFDGELLESAHESDAQSLRALIPYLKGEEITVHADQDVSGKIDGLFNNQLRLLMADGSVQLIPNFERHRITFRNPQALSRVQAPLQLRLKSENRGRQDLNLFYVLHDLGWSAEHRVIMNEDTGKAAWKTYAIVHNQSSNRFENVTLRFFSGDIILQSGGPSPRVYRSAHAEVAFDAAEVPGIAVSETGDFYMYTYDELTSLEPNQKRQILIFSGDEIRFEKQYSHNFSVQGANRTNVKPVVQVDFKTAGNGGIGHALPAGLTRFFAFDGKDVSPVVRAETNIPYVTPGERLNIPFGRATDISIVETREITHNRGERYTDYKLKAVVTNNRNEAVVVDLLQTLASNMEILSTGIQPQREGNTLTYPVQVRRDSSAEFEVVIRQFHRN